MGSVWDPPGVVLQEGLESVQKGAARFVIGNYNYETGSMTGILGLILLYKGLKGKASVSKGKATEVFFLCKLKCVFSQGFIITFLI